MPERMVLPKFRACSSACFSSFSYRFYRRIGSLQGAYPIYRIFLCVPSCPLWLIPVFCSPLPASLSQTATPHKHFVANKSRTLNSKGLSKGCRPLFFAFFRPRITLLPVLALLFQVWRQPPRSECLANHAKS